VRVVCCVRGGVSKTYSCQEYEQNVLFLFTIATVLGGPSGMATQWKMRRRKRPTLACLREPNSQLTHNNAGNLQHPCPPLKMNTPPAKRPKFNPPSPSPPLPSPTPLPWQDIHDHIQHIKCHVDSLQKSNSHILNNNNAIWALRDTLRDIEVSLRQYRTNNEVSPSPLLVLSSFSPLLPLVLPFSSLPSSSLPSSSLPSSSLPSSLLLCSPPPPSSPSPSPAIFLSLLLITIFQH